jgi:hypothetical protein
MKRVVRPGARGRLAHQQVKRGGLHAAVKPLAKMAGVQRPVDALQQVVADPVGFYDARVHRIGDAVRTRDELQVWVGAGERAQVARQSGVGRVFPQIRLDLGVDVRTAIAEVVGHEGEPREHAQAVQRTRHPNGIVIP